MWFLLRFSLHAKHLAVFFALGYFTRNASKEILPLGKSLADATYRIPVMFAFFISKLFQKIWPKDYRFPELFDASYESLRLSA